MQAPNPSRICGATWAEIWPRSSSNNNNNHSSSKRHSTHPHQEAPDLVLLLPLQLAIVIPQRLPYRTVRFILVILVLYNRI
jgi:hypothetical protein